MAKCPKCQRQTLMHDETVCPHCSTSQKEFWKRLARFGASAGATFLAIGLFFRKTPRS